MDLRNPLYAAILANPGASVFFDMDGVINFYDWDFYQGISPSGMPKYRDESLHVFRNAVRDDRAYHLLKACLKAGAECYLLSKADPSLPWIDPDKRIWARRWVPEVPESHIIIAESDKAEAIRVAHDISSLWPGMVLVDDFNPNLQDWQDAGGTSIKYLNGINTAASWSGPCIDRQHVPEKP